MNPEQDTQNTASVLLYKIVRIRAEPYALIYEHSALLVNVYREDNNSWVTTFSTCNHGTCADSTEMSDKCSIIFHNRHYLPISDMMCDTYGYNNNFPWDHLCNNDTLEEYLALGYDFVQDFGVCTPRRVYAPDCYTPPAQGL